MKDWSLFAINEDKTLHLTWSSITMAHDRQTHHLKLKGTPVTLCGLLLYGIQAFTCARG